MACAALMEKKKRVPVATAGIVLCVITAVLVIAGIWPKIDSEEYWKATGTSALLALAFTYSFLLALPDLDDRHKWMQPASFISIGILTLLIISDIWFQTHRWKALFFRTVGVVAILTALETLVIPILVKLRKGQRAATVKLVLEKIEGDLYKDTAGRKYHLKLLDTE